MQAIANDFNSERAAQPRPAPMEVAQPKGSNFAPQEYYRLTQLGNAERFVNQYRNLIRYCHAYKSWLVWDGCRWQPDRDARINRFAYRTAQSIYAEAKRMVEGDFKESTQRKSRVSTRSKAWS